MTTIVPTDKVFYFSIEVPYSYCEALYQQGNNTVVMTADSGQRVQVPTMRLRPFVDRQGIKGRFRLIVDEKHKIKAFERVN